MKIIIELISITSNENNYNINITFNENNYNINIYYNQ